MKVLYNRVFIVGVFLLLATLLIAEVIVTRPQLAVQTEYPDREVHTEKVLFELSQTRLLLADADAGLRGYLYTGDPSYLEPCSSAVAELKPHIDQLSLLLEENPKGREHVDKLRTLLEQKMTLMSQTIQLSQSGYSNFAKTVALPESDLVIMKHIQEMTSQIARDGASLHSERSAMQLSSVGRTALVYLDSGILMACVVLLAVYISDQIKFRDRYSKRMLEREAWFRLILASLEEGVIATDKRGRITFLNPIAERLVSRTFEEASGQPVESVFQIFNETTDSTIASADRRSERLKEPTYLMHDTVMRWKDANLIRVEDGAVRLIDRHLINAGQVLVFRGDPANAPLKGVGSRIYLVKPNGRFSPISSDPLAWAEKELARAARIQRQILGLYRDYSPPGLIDLSALLGCVLESFSNTLREKRLTVERAIQDRPTILGLSADLDQAIANLVSNAIDAAPYGGTIRLELSCHESAEGKVALISVHDNGPGIAPSDKTRIFEPFFSTKDNDAGLGLWVCKGIVERHGGTIQTYSGYGTEEPGTVFNIVLPIENGPFHYEGNARQSYEPQRSMPLGFGRVGLQF